MELETLKRLIVTAYPDAKLGPIPGEAGLLLSGTCETLFEDPDYENGISYESGLNAEFQHWLFRYGFHVQPHEDGYAIIPTAWLNEHHPEAGFEAGRPSNLSHCLGCASLMEADGEQVCGQFRCWEISTPFCWHLTFWNPG